MSQAPLQPSNGSVVVPLNEEERAAVEGWRAANALETSADAVRELVRLGLLSEIARAYRSVTQPRIAEIGGDGSAENRL